jgi:hypothetical protein
MTFKQRLMTALLLADKERSDLYKPTGLSIQAVGNLLRGKTDTFSAAHTVKAARYLGVSAYWLATGEGPIHGDMDPACQPLLEALAKIPTRKRKAAIRLAERLVDICATGDQSSIQALHEFLHIKIKHHSTDSSHAATLPYQPSQPLQSEQALPQNGATAGKSPQVCLHNTARAGLCSWLTTSTPTEAVMNQQRTVQDAIEHREQLAAQAYTSLYEEWLEAAAQDPLREIPTPGHHHPREQLIYLILDAFNGQDGDEMLIDTVKALQETDKGKAVLDRMARDHARYHCAERLTSLLESDDVF